MMHRHTTRIDHGGSPLQRAFFVFFLVVGCGAGTDEEAKEDPAKTSGTVVVTNSLPAKTEKLVPIPINITTPTSQTGLALANPVDGYQIQLASCLSGYTATVDQVAAELEVYRFDRDCEARLTQITFEGIDYFPTAGAPFTTWAAGDTAVFDEAGEPGTSPLEVIVLQTLNDPVTGAEVISYGVRYLAQGASRSILWSTIGTSGKLMDGGNTEPSFAIYQTELVDLSATEAGQFQFVLECNSDIGATSTCETVDFVDIDYILIEDTYGGTPTLGDLDTAFTSGTSITLPDDRIAPGASGTTNGGFITATLDGPATLASKPNMLLVLRSYAESYQYFNVDITTY